MALTDTSEVTRPIDKKVDTSDKTEKNGLSDQYINMSPSEQRGTSSKGDDTNLSKLGLPQMQIFDFGVGKDVSPMINDGARKPEIKTTLDHHLGSDLNDRIIKTVASNEGKLTTLTKNDAGAGISIGIRQWNQKKGELPDLMKSWHDENPEKFEKIFGKHTDNMLSERYIRRANMAGNKDLMGRIKTALADPEFQQVQVDKFREFADKSAETAKKYGLKSELGAALVADITNQMGEGGARRIMRKAGLKPGQDVEDEEKALKLMEKLTRRPNSSARFEQLASNFSPDKSMFNGGRDRGRNPISDPRTFLAQLEITNAATA
jgi:hypothetical protein